MTTDEYIKLSEKYLTGNINPNEFTLLQELDPDFEVKFYNDDQKIIAHTTIGKRIFERIEKDISQLYLIKRRKTILF